MADTIRGPVTNVIDGDTFDMKVTHVGESNKNKYNNEERIRIADIDAPELRTSAGKRSKEQLSRKLNGKQIRCYIQARDTYGRIVAEVQIL
jgi:endonuclease YncB( thermonuclease family)